MALSGSLTTTGGFEGRNLKFTWEAAQNVENNTSTIKWTLTGAGGDSNYWYNSAPFTVTINGSTVYSSSTRIQLRQNTVVATGENIVSHNSVGEASLKVSVSAAIYYTSVNSTGSQTWTLNTIPRATTPSLSANTVALGGTLTINTPAASVNYRHKLYYSWQGAPWVLIEQGVMITHEWDLPISLAGSIPNTDKGTGLIRCETYDDTTRIGTKEVKFTGYVPDTPEFKPTISTLIDEPTGYMGKYGAMVKGHSRLRAKTQCWPKFSASITEIQVTVDGATYKGEDVTTEAILSPDTDTVEIRVVAVDSRGLKSTPFVETFSALDYAAPTIDALAVHRCDKNGNDDAKGEYVGIKFSATVTPLRNYNSANYTIRCTKGTDGSTDYIDLPELSGTYTVTDYTLPPISMDGSSSWGIELAVQDDLNTGRRSTSVSTAFTMMNWSDGGTGMGIGKVAEKENTLQVALDLEALGPTTFQGHATFQGGVSGVLPDTVDHIVEAGTEAMDNNGTWYWVKWASGRAECYGMRNYGDMAISTAWGGWYRSPYFQQTFPEGLFIEPPDYLDINVQKCVSGSGIVERGLAGLLAEETNPFCLVYPLMANFQQVYFNFRAIGRWK